MRDALPEMKTTAPSLESVVFQARGRRLLDGATLRPAAEGVTVLLGPNGAGKSLSLRILAGLLSPHGGAVRNVGRAVLVSQRPVLLRRSAAANLRFALKIYGVPRRERAQAAADWLSLAGLNDHADRPARRLSGGEQQRLALVRALAARPQALLLDEPAASLDPAATAAVESLIALAAAEGAKVILVTHDLGQARRLAGDVAFLHKGRVVEHSDADRFFDGPRTPEARAYLAGDLLL